MKHLTKLIFGMVVLMLLVGAWVAPAAAADVEQARDYTGAKYAYRLMLLRLDTLQDIIDHAEATADLADKYIADEQAAGYDTSVLETGLSKLRTKIDEAQDHLNTAARILADHAGFDDDGNVTDPQQARETMKNAREAMQDVGKALHDGREEFREAFQSYRQSKRDK